MSDSNEQLQQLKEQLQQAQQTISELEKNNILIAKSAEEHVLELERELQEKELKLNEAIHANLQIISSAEQHIEELEIELKKAMEKERKLKGDNVEIAKSAADHVNELMGEIIDLKSKQEKNYQIRVDLEREMVSNKAARHSIIESKPSPSPAPSPSSSALKEKVNILKFRQGYLAKKSPSSILFIKLWQQRYFVLKEQGQLSYWKTYNDYNGGKKYQGTLFLNDVRDAHRNWNSLRPSETYINIHIFDRVYELNASSKEEADQWAKSLMAHWSS